MRAPWAAARVRFARADRTSRRSTRRAASRASPARTVRAAPALRSHALKAAIRARPISRAPRRATIARQAPPAQLDPLSRSRAVRDRSRPSSVLQRVRSASRAAISPIRAEPPALAARAATIVSAARAHPSRARPAPRPTRRACIACRSASPLDPAFGRRRAVRCPSPVLSPASTAPAQGSMTSTSRRAQSRLCSTRAR